MERNANYIIVGLFVVLVLVASALFTIWLAGTHDSREFSRYTVLFDSAVNGLEEGSAVKYRGVSVGRVISIRLVEDNPDLIKVIVDVDRSTPVRSSTKGTLKSQGITGLSFIELKTESTDKIPVQVPDGELYPVIKAEASQLDKLFDDVPKLTSRLITLSDKLISITGKVDLLLTDENMTHISNTIVDIHQITQGVNTILSGENRGAITASIKNFEAASHKIDTIASAISKNDSNLSRFTGEGLDELVLLIRDAREMSSAIKELANSLDEDPSRIIFQSQHDGVKIKK